MTLITKVNNITELIDFDPEEFKEEFKKIPLRQRVQFYIKLCDLNAHLLENLRRISPVARKKRSDAKDFDIKDVR